MPRPLVNLFRIAFQIDSLSSLVAIVKEIQTDSSERSRHQDTLTRKIGEYLALVWPDYDQSIRITLEKERIRVAFMDPSHEDASYYEMQERSQGCQTFVSFLLTIGAEAKQGVIANTILLLDEPETHLHPSGVRYMLAELISAADNGNIVLFATHSIFMVDKRHYDRHLIIRKEHEQTVIQPSTKDRIGYFMQEEVLYGAIDGDLGSVLPARKRLNFVLEGEADVVLLEAYYYEVLRNSDRPIPLKDTELYQGGKCSDIRKYLEHKPIQLGSKWVFVLDNDNAARSLREFIEGRYRSYLGQDIFVLQYSAKGGSEAAELEDLLPVELLMSVLRKVCEDRKLVLDVDSLDSDGVFSERWVKALGGVDEKAVKPFFKAELNSRIVDALKDVKQAESFAEFVGDYAEWVAPALKDVLETIRTHG